ncbi:MAG: bifunctional folylpolyglutamate synthase/dihydrofolate synthase [Armatimonadetes bacterium]|nr:bifunctional folylpolyglutamate synthase/dihydrofolate synthase [Armatimonadota bacterium]
MTQLATYLQNLQRFGIQPGLERIRALCQSAGNPHLAYPTILVGGTNGKGSTCEFTARLLAQSGRKIGLYTSPHLYEWNERIRILPGEGLFEGAITDADLDALLNDALPHIEAVAQSLGQPTEFEVMTFLGLWHFARQKVDAAVIEVGLGGKWDATNVTEPLVSVVTHVALDHMDRLGNTLEEIAADKVCIARAGRPFVTGEHKENVLEVFRAHCEKIGANFYQANLSHGDFALANRQLARSAAITFSKSFGWSIDIQSPGLNVRGRFETIATSPQVIIDGANNPDGAQNVAAELKRRQIQAENLILVLGILADKDFAQMTQILTPLAKIVIVTQSDSPRAASTTQIAPIARQFCAHVEEIVPVAAAVERAQTLAGAGDTILVTGSFTTIAEVPRPLSP